METGLIPPNLNFKEAKKNVKALQEGRMKVITEITPWENNLIGLNSFGFGGANAHILLKSNPKQKINKGMPTDKVPRLVCVSARTEEGVNSLLDDVSKCY